MWRRDGRVRRAAAGCRFATLLRQVSRIAKRAWLLVLVSAVLQVLAFPSPSLYFLCWVSLAPLLVAVLGEPEPGRAQVLELRLRELGATTVLQGFLLAYVSGILWYAGTCFWIYRVMHTYGGLPGPAAMGILALFCLYLGLYHGAFGGLLVLAQGKAGRAGALALAPFLWVGVELARTRISGVPCNLLGTAQVDNISLGRVATVTGVYGLSFGIALVNAAFAAAWLLPRHRRQTMLGAAVLSAVLLQAGVLMQPPPAPTTHTAILVQPNLPILDAGEWTLPFFQKTLAELSAASVAARQNSSPGRAAGPIVWPESPAPFFSSDPQFRHTVSAMATATHSYLVVGNIAVRSTGQRERPAEMLNSASLVGPQGEWLGRYDKIHLVPFGEYVPYKPIFGFIHKITREVGDFGRGSERTVFDLGGERLGVFICYESIFPDEVRQFARSGAEAFVNISNDGWFGRWGAAEQHLNMARMRAVENHRWLLRSTNTGITAAIDPYGRVVAGARRDVRTTLEAPYALLHDTTFYTEHGDWFAFTCAIICLVGLLTSIRARVLGTAGRHR